ncbi:putative EG45-like domain containing protein 1 [Typha latifolia]|uniref:putative EG45-like domain containing protein 1 n=1 Tax=Typha latifolia TaxID=4733 RepID=UPI003C2DB50B
MCNLLVLSFLLIFLPSLSTADVGTASSYGPPFLPTVCFGGDESQFPPDNLFAAAGEGIWDNGASCGRQYIVRCLSSATPDACVEGQRVQIVVVDRATELHSTPSSYGTTLVLSRRAYGLIAKQTVDEINIEFTQV